MELSDELKTALAADNEAVQIQVCSDYNFHAEEEFKLKYWTKVLLILSTSKGQHSHIKGVSVYSLKQWWAATVSNRSLPGLSKILFELTSSSRKRTSDFTTMSAVWERYNTIFRLTSSQTRQTFASKLSEAAKWAFNGLFGVSLIDESFLDEYEIILSNRNVHQIAKGIFTSLQSSTNSGSAPPTPILVSESDISKLLLQQSALGEIKSPFVGLSISNMTAIIMTELVESFKAVPFQVNNAFCCLKLPPFDATPPPEVTDNDKAQVMSRIASEKLIAEESNLTHQWTEADELIKQHLAAGRRALALTALKQRKLIEQRMDEIQMFKLKLAECHSVTQTAIFQQTVIDAISSAASVANRISPEEVENVLQEALETRTQVDQVSLAIGESIKAQSDDESILLEYEQLVRAEKTDSDLIDSIPSPPTQLPAQPAPTLIVPEEYIYDQ